MTVSTRRKGKRKGSKARGAGPRRKRPLADKLVKKIHGSTEGTVLDLAAVRAGRENAEALQKTVSTRVLPPPLQELDDHVVFTTPYILVDPGEPEWSAYLERNLPEGTPEDRRRAYERHLKFGPSRDYWTEFVVEAYANHRHNVIFLEGLPDRPETRPHSSVNG